MRLIHFYKILEWNFYLWLKTMMAAGRATQEFLQLCVRPPLHPAQAITDLILCIIITYNTLTIVIYSSYSMLYRNKVGIYGRK
jgi:hypothetical protein